MLEVYRDFAEDVLAMPVIAGEKPEHERFPGAVTTYSIEAMMQDGKALQSGTSHYLGDHFAKAQNIRFQTETGELGLLPHHQLGRLDAADRRGDHDPRRRRRPAPAAGHRAAPDRHRADPARQARGRRGAGLLRGAGQRSCGAARAFGAPIRAIVDKKPIRSADKRWDWVRRGAPVIVEIGPRDAAGGQVTFMRRDALRDGEKVASTSVPRGGFIGGAERCWPTSRPRCYAEAKARLDGNIRADIATLRGAGRLFRARGGGRGRHQRLQGLGARALEPADRRCAGGGGRPFEDAEADHPRRARPTSRPASAPACSPARRGWRKS